MDLEWLSDWPKKHLPLWCSLSYLPQMTRLTVHACQRDVGYPVRTTLPLTSILDAASSLTGAETLRSIVRHNRSVIAVK